VHPDMAFVVAKQQQRELGQVAKRRRPLSASAARPGPLQRLAARAAGWGRRPALISGRLVVVFDADDALAV